MGHYTTEVGTLNAIAYYAILFGLIDSTGWSDSDFNAWLRSCNVSIFCMQAAGALAIIVVDNTDGPLVLMNSRGLPSYDITIPAIFISKADGNLMKDMVEGQLVSFGTVCLAAIRYIAA